MQTFLPYPDFKKSAQALDYKRLGKQRVEARQLLQGLRGEIKSKWVFHPASKMWMGYNRALAVYGAHCCMEWNRRGYKDNLLQYFLGVLAESYIPGYHVQQFLVNDEIVTDGQIIAVPTWLGLPKFHESHQSNLVRKLPEHYGPMFPGVPNYLPYYWPIV